MACGRIKEKICGLRLMSMHSLKIMTAKKSLHLLSGRKICGYSDLEIVHHHKCGWFSSLLLSSYKFDFIVYDME